MAYNTSKRKIDKITLSSETNSLKIKESVRVNKKVDQDYLNLNITETAVQFVRNKTIDWTDMIGGFDQEHFSILGGGTVGGDGEYDTSEQYQNFTVDFGVLDIRIIPFIIVEPIYRQKFEGVDDDAEFDNTRNLRKIWSVDLDGNVQLHIGVFLGYEGDVVFNETVYQVKLIVDIINPREYI